MGIINVRRLGLLTVTVIGLIMAIVVAGCPEAPTAPEPTVNATITKPKKDETVGQLLTVEGYVKDKDKSTYVITIDSGVNLLPTPIADASFKNDVKIKINDQDATVDMFSVLIDVDGLLNGEHALKLEGLDDVAVPVIFVLDKVSRPGKPEITDITGGVKISDIPPIEVAASGALTFIGKTVESVIDVQIYSGVGSSNPALVASGTSTNFSFEIVVTSLGSASGEENEYIVAARAVNALGNFSDSQAAKVFWDTKSPTSTITTATSETDVVNSKVDRGAVVSLEVTISDKFTPRFDLTKSLGKVEVFAGSTSLGTATRSPENPNIFTLDWDTGDKTSANAFVIGTGVQAITAVVTDLVEQMATSANTLNITVETGAPKIATVVFNDTIPGDGAAAGDTITVTFTQEITLSSSTPSSAFSLTDPTGATTPSFGTNASMTGTGTTVTITLGTSPVLDMAGAEINGTRIDIVATNTVIQDLLGNNAEELTIVDDGKDNIEITPSDSARPTVTSVTVTDTNDEVLGSGDDVQLVVTFSEQMDDTMNPTLTLAGLTFTGGTWSAPTGGGTLNSVYTVTNTGTPTEGVLAISVSAAQDLFGNTMVTDSSNTHDVDLTAPSIESVTFNDIGSLPGTPDAGDTITVVFDENIIEATANLTNFDVFVAGAVIANTTPFGTGFIMAVGAANEIVITLGSSPVIVVNQTYSSAAGTASGIDLDTDGDIGITDLAGNVTASGPTNGSTAKDIALAAGAAPPTIVSAKVTVDSSTSTVATTGSTGLTVIVSFSQSMDTSLDPSITIDLINGAPTFTSGTWSGNDKIYTVTSSGTITFDSSDTTANKQATILSARNVLGLLMASANVNLISAADTSQNFSIDATNPKITAATINQISTVLTVTFDESMATTTTDASTLFTLSGAGTGVGGATPSLSGSSIVFSNAVGSINLAAGHNILARASTTTINVTSTITTELVDDNGNTAATTATAITIGLQ